MHMKRSLAALLSATMTISSQIAVPMSASAADTSSTADVQTAVTTTATAPKTEALPLLSQMMLNLLLLLQLSHPKMYLR